MKHRHSATIHGTILYTICTIAFVFTLHLTLPMYVNSSFLGQFTSEANVGIIYTIASIMTIAGLLLASHFLTKFGNEKMALTLIGIQLLVYYGLSTSSSFYVIASLFIVNTIIVALISLNLDIFLEVYTDARHTGGIRGLYMTVVNTAWIIAPLTAGLLIDGTENYRYIYYASFALLFPLIYMVKKNFAHFKDPQYPHISITKSIVEIGKHHNMTKLFFANTILNIFYGWMIIYSPVYLHETIGFGWDQIGIIFTIMLLPFVLFELPLGRLVDKKWGEKEIMTIGFILTGLATCVIAFVHSQSVVVWALVFFITRVGASMAETMVEIYFFKKVDPRESNVLSMFRITRPLAFIIAPAITSFGLLFTTHQNLFIILGVFMFTSIFFTATLRDTN